MDNAWQAWKRSETPDVDELATEIEKNRFDRDYEFEVNLSQIIWLAFKAGFDAASE